MIIKAAKNRTIRKNNLPYLLVTPKWGSCFPFISMSAYREKTWIPLKKNETQLIGKKARSSLSVKREPYFNIDNLGIK